MLLITCCPDQKCVCILPVFSEKLWLLSSSDLIPLQFESVCECVSDSNLSTVDPCRAAFSQSNQSDCSAAAGRQLPKSVFDSGFDLILHQQSHLLLTWYWCLKERQVIWGKCLATTRSQQQCFWTIFEVCNNVHKIIHFFILINFWHQVLLHWD